MHHYLSGPRSLGAVAIMIVFMGACGSGDASSSGDTAAAGGKDNSGGGVGEGGKGGTLSSGGGGGLSMAGGSGATSATGGGAGGNADAGVGGGRGGNPDAGTDAASASQFVLPAEAKANLVLWLDATRDVTLADGRVSLWKDQSGSGNDARQDVAAMRPVTFTTTAGPAVRFTTVAKSVLTLANAASLNWGTGDFTLLVAAAYSNKSNVPKFTGAGAFYFKQATAGGEVGLYGNWPRNMMDMGFVFARVGGEGQADLGTKETTLNDGVLRLYELRRTGMKMEIRLNGTVSASGTFTPANVDGTMPASIGGKLNGTFPIEGDIHAVLAWKGAVADASLAKVEAALTTALHIAK